MAVVAASGNALDVSTGAGVAALAVAVIALLGLVWVWNSTRPKRVRPGPPVMELREETPAVVDLLTGGFSVEDDAVPATVVDLAARGYYTIEDVGGDRTVIRLRGDSRSTDDLAAYEQRVLRHLHKLAVDGVLPVQALTLGPEGVSQRWYRGFVREVTADGRSLGLCRRRWNLRHLAVVWGLAGLAFAPAMALIAVADRTTDPNGWGAVGNLLVGLALLVATGLVWLATRITGSDSQLDTEAGREAAAHWLGVRDFYRDSGRFEDKPASSVAIWDRHLAYATALGLAPVVQRQIPFETEHDRHVWSRASGHWRRIKVRYQALRPGWGQHPGSVAFTGLVRAVLFGLLAAGGWYVAGADTELETLSAQQRQWVGLGGLVVAVLAAAACVYGVVLLVLGLLDLFPRRTVEGEVVRRRIFRSGHRLPKVVQWAVWSGKDEHGFDRDQNRRTRHHLAVDPGDVDRIVAHTVTSSIYGSAPQGAVVRMRVSPLLGYVSSLEVLQAPRPSAAGEAAVLHPLAEEAVTAATGAVSAQVDQALSAVETMTDEDGRPVLDQRDESGVTLRDRLAESSEQIEQLRSDPRVAGNPIVGKLLDALSGVDRGDEGPTDDPDDPTSV